MNTLNKCIFAALCIALVIVLGYKGGQVRSFAPSPTPHPLPTPPLEPELKRRAVIELPPSTILRLFTLQDKLKNREKFMQQARTMNREQLLQTVEDLARIAGNCEQRQQ